MKTDLLFKALLIIVLGIFTNCSEKNDVEPDKDFSIVVENQKPERFATALNDSVLQTGLNFVVEKAQEFKAAGRSGVDFDFKKLLGAEAVKSFDSVSSNTTYVYFTSRTDSSFTNFIISEKNGIYVAFFMEYLPTDTQALDDISLFEGNIKLSSVSGEFSDLMSTRNGQSSNGRSSVCLTETRCWQFSVPGAGYFGEVQCETIVSCTSFSGNYVAGGLDTGTEDSRNPLSSYGSLTNNSMPDKVPVNSELNSFLRSNVWNPQKPYDDWNDLTECEKEFFKTYPAFLYQAKKDRTMAETAANQRFPLCSIHNGIGDAFRHAYFSALNARRMGYTNAKRLGDCHESETPANRINEKNMDLHNNQWGYDYAAKYGVVQITQFYNEFMEAYKNGEIKTLKEC